MTTEITTTKTTQAAGHTGADRSSQEKKRQNTFDERYEKVRNSPPAKEDMILLLRALAAEKAPVHVSFPRERLGTPTGNARTRAWKDWFIRLQQLDRAIDQLHKLGLIDDSDPDPGVGGVNIAISSKGREAWDAVCAMLGDYDAVIEEFGP